MVIVSLLLPALAAAQDDGQVSAIMAFLGVTSIEDADAEEFERLSDMFADPLEINAEGQEKLVSSGLFTRYQAASLTDYRDRHGDVLSLTELAALDGFGERHVVRIASFISLSVPDASVSRRYRHKALSHDVAVRSSVRSDGGASGYSGSYGMKYRLEYGDCLSMTAGVAASYTSYPSPYAVRGSMSYANGRGKIVIGDYNARFGQGLVVWNGMSFGGLGTPGAYIRNPSGISQPWSFSGSSSLTGAAAEYSFGPLTLSLLSDASGLVSGRGDAVFNAADLTWRGRNGEVSLTSAVSVGMDRPVCREAVASVSQRWCLRGVDLSSEVSCDWTAGLVAAAGGASLRCCEWLRIASLCRYYPSLYGASHASAPRTGTKTANEYGVSSGAEVNVRDRLEGTLSADMAYFPVGKAGNAEGSRQLTLRSDMKLLVSPGISVGIRLSERMRTWGRDSKTGLRADIVYDVDSWYAALRLEGVLCAGAGMLAMAETGYRIPRLSVFLRAGVFRADDWDDRIYVYERDAPGSFNVPVRYGRGLWSAFTSSYRFSPWGRLYFRASVVDYPFMKEEKPGRAELKLQLSVSL